jgi:hypothetical protein
LEADGAVPAGRIEGPLRSVVGSPIGGLCVRGIHLLDEGSFMTRFLFGAFFFSIGCISGFALPTTIDYRNDKHYVVFEDQLVVGRSKPPGNPARLTTTISQSSKIISVKAWMADVPHAGFDRISLIGLDTSNPNVEYVRGWAKGYWGVYKASSGKILAADFLNWKHDRDRVARIEIIYTNSDDPPENFSEIVEESVFRPQSLVPNYEVSRFDNMSRVWFYGGKWPVRVVNANKGNYAETREYLAGDGLAPVDVGNGELALYLDPQTGQWVTSVYLFRPLPDEPPPLSYEVPVVKF